MLDKTSVKFLRTFWCLKTVYNVVSSLSDCCIWRSQSKLYNIVNYYLSDTHMWQHSSQFYHQHSRQTRLKKVDYVSPSINWNETNWSLHLFWAHSILFFDCYHQACICTQSLWLKKSHGELIIIFICQSMNAWSKWLEVNSQSSM